MQKFACETYSDLFGASRNISSRKSICHNFKKDIKKEGMLRKDNGISRNLYAVGTTEAMISVK